MMSRLYFQEQEKYTKIHGDKTVVFFEMGKFYDAYCQGDKGYQKLEDLEQLLNIHYIRRKPGKSNPHNKPSQFGINTVSIRKNLTTMVENGYTVVLFDQKFVDTSSDGSGKNSNKIIRECAGVYSPGTFISERQQPDAVNI